MKEYLGDGCYVEAEENGTIKLTAEDGIRATDVIWLEPEVYAALVQFVERRRAAKVERMTALSESEVRDGR